MPLDLRTGELADHLVAFLSCFVNDLEEEEEASRGFGHKQTRVLLVATVPSAASCSFMGGLAGCDRQRLRSLLDLV